MPVKSFRRAVAHVATAPPIGTGVLVAVFAALVVGLDVSSASAQPTAAGDAISLTSGEADYMDPEWSPDGSRIAFTQAKYQGIAVLDVESGAVEQITDEPSAGYGFSWSPDGQSLLTRVARYEGPRRYNAVKVFDVQNGEARQVTEYRTSMPALPRWDKSGDRVLLYVDDDLEVFELSPPSPSKSAAPELLSAGQGFVSADPTSGTAARLETFDEMQILNLVESPDGSRVAFEVMGGDMYAMSADGSDIVNLGPGNRPSWSPDGEWIVFMRTEDDGHRITSADLYVVSADGSVRQPLTATSDRLEMNPSWSPDGSRIAFDAGGAIYVLPLAR